MFRDITQRIPLGLAAAALIVFLIVDFFGDVSDLLIAGAICLMAPVAMIVLGLLAKHRTERLATELAGGRRSPRHVAFAIAAYLAIGLGLCGSFGAAWLMVRTNFLLGSAAATHAEGWISTLAWQTFKGIPQKIVCNAKIVLPRLEDACNALTPDASQSWGWYSWVVAWAFAGGLTALLMLALEPVKRILSRPRAQ